MENRAAVAAAAEGEEDRAFLLVIATALRGAVVDAAALDRARACSMLLDDISSSQRERESRETGSRRCSSEGEGGKQKVA